MSIARRPLLASLLGFGLLPSALHGRETAAPVLLAKVFDPAMDPSPYLVSEKYDGVRALWDGRTLRFRSGRAVHAPAWFLDRLPASPLDGELWLGRSRFDDLSGIVRRAEAVDDEWRQLRYMVFELPGGEGSFIDRHARLGRVVQAVAWPQLQRVEQRRVADRQALQHAFEDVTRGGGEGLMLHLADAPYTTGRSDVLLKLKPLLDTEATVIAHVLGHGKFAGMMGALDLRTPAGQRVRVGTGFSDEQRRLPPPVGSTVTFAYRDLTSGGVPRFASFVRVHEDL